MGYRKLIWVSILFNTLFQYPVEESIPHQDTDFRYLYLFRYQVIDTCIDTRHQRISHTFLTCFGKCPSDNEWHILGEWDWGEKLHEYTVDMIRGPMMLHVNLYPNFLDMISEANRFQSWLEWGVNLYWHFNIPRLSRKPNRLKLSSCYIELNSNLYNYC